jgi:hypothetical protein
MTREQNARTKGETYVVIENPNRSDNYDPVPRYFDWAEPRRYSRPWIPDHIYWGVPPWMRPSRWHGNHWAPQWRPFYPSSFWSGFKVAIITLIAAPIVIIELAMLLDFLRQH